MAHKIHLTQADANQWKARALRAEEHLREIGYCLDMLHVPRLVEKRRLMVKERMRMLTAEKKQMKLF